MNVANHNFRRRQQSVFSASTSTTTSSSNDNSSGIRSRRSSSLIISRRRTRRNSVDFSSTASSSSSRPLQGVVACLSGQPEDVKCCIHDIIQKWGGGSVMGNFDPKFVTHLILDAPVGSKYLNWKRHLELHRKQLQKQQQHHENEDNDNEIQSSTWAEKLIVVTTSWVEACQLEGRRVSEDRFQLLRSSDDGDGDDGMLYGLGGLAAAEGAKMSLPSSLCLHENARKQLQCHHNHHHYLFQQGLPAEIRKRAPTIARRCLYMLQNIPPNDYCSLFAGQSFLLVGFDSDDNPNERDNDDVDENDDGSESYNYCAADDTATDTLIRSNEDDSDNSGGSASSNPGDLGSCLPGKRRIYDCGGHYHVVSSQNHHRTGRDRRDRQFRSTKEKCRSLKVSMSKLIRRAGGTIFWEPNEWITTVLLNEKYSKCMWDDVRYFCREHPKGPICVTVDWILTSIFFYRERSNISMITPPPPFPPEPEMQLTTKSKRNRAGGVVVGGESSNSTSSENTTRTITAGKIPESKSTTTSSIFRGDVFAISLSKSTCGTLSFRYEDMESTIIGNGGLLLTKSLLLAIKNDAKKSAASMTNRGYYVVSNSWVHIDGASSLPLLAELSKLGIKVIPVSLVWISACVKNDRKYDPAEYPLLFQPQTWPIRRLSKIPSSSKIGRNFSFMIALTGFVDSSRYGIMSMLDEIGAQYTDNLTRNNTHLICKEGRGMKYTKALEWRLHIVSIEWLYHIIRYGFQDGCESKFPISAI